VWKICRFFVKLSFGLNLKTGQLNKKIVVLVAAVVFLNYACKLLELPLCR